MRTVLVAAVAASVLGCSGTETIQPVNQAPTIAFAFEKIVVQKGVAVDLNVNVSDANDDPLTITWQITSGTLVAQNAENTVMRWTPLNSIGVDTARVSVSDGQESDSIVEAIKRGTRTTAGVAPQSYFKHESPYILDTPRLAVLGATTTTIEAGVELYLEQEDAVIDVVGTLRATGTESERVLIRPNNRTFRCGGERGWWKGIEATTSDQSGFVDLAYTDVLYGICGVFLFVGDASANLQHCRIMCSNDAGIRISGSGTLTVEHCEISNNQNYGIAISSLAELPQAVSIRYNEIINNGHTGVFIDLRDNLQQVPILIQYNRVEFNGVNGILLASASWAGISYNDISLNNLSTVSNIRIVPPFPSGMVIGGQWDTLLVQHNYWGQAYDEDDVDAIEKTIIDATNHGQIQTEVIVSPWENQSQYAP